jgi:hypothetical protein
MTDHNLPGPTRWLAQIDRKTQLVAILLLFWGLFWMLNGGDKFFNSAPEPNLESWSTQSVVVDGSGDVVGEVHPVLADGWYGVSRNNKMANYFERLGFPRPVAMASLYGIAIVEMVIGATFLVLFAHAVGPAGWRRRSSAIAALLRDRTIHRLAFKAGISVFALFSVADIFFGDRIELWEHGTFLILALITHELWARSDAPAALDMAAAGVSAVETNLRYR